MELLDLLGEAICHRDPNRTQGVAWVCLRCTALYSAGLVGVSWAGLFRKLALWGQLLIAGVLLLPVFLDGAFIPWGSSLDQPWVRITTGALAGLGSGLFMGARARAVVRWPQWLQPLAKGAPVLGTVAVAAAFGLPLVGSNRFLVDPVTIVGLVLLCFAGTGWAWAALGWLAARRRPLLKDGFERHGLVVMAVLVPVELVIVSVVPDSWKPGMGWIDAILGALGMGALTLLVVPAGTARAHLPHDTVAEVAVEGSGDTAHIVAQYLYPARRMFVISEDGGRTWAFRADADSVNVLENLEITDDGLLFAADEGIRTVLRSDDGGYSWERSGDVPAEAYPVWQVRVPPDYAAHPAVYAMLDESIAAWFVSTNEGASWEWLDGWVGAMQVAVGPGPASQRHVWACDPMVGSLWVSTNGGEQVSELCEEFPFCSALALTPGYPDGNVVLGGGHGDIAIGDASGCTWTMAHPGAEDDSWDEIADIAALSEDRILAIDPDEAVFCTDDAGADGFALCDDGLPELTPQHSSQWGWFRRLAASAADPDLVALASWQGLYLSEDGGERWDEACFLRPSYVRGLAFSPAYPDDPRIFVGSYGGGLTVSPDGGESWAVQADAQEYLHLEALTLAPAFPDDPRMFLVASRRLLRSPDGGGHWNRMALDGVAALHHLVLSPAFEDDGVAFAVGTTADEGRHAIDRSDDGGASWSAVWVGAEPPGPQIERLVLSPSFDGQGPLYGLQVSPSQLLVSIDGGASWSLEFDPGEGLLEVWAFAAAGGDELLLVTASGRVLRRPPGGSFTDISYVGAPPLRGHTLDSGAIAVSLDPVGLSISRDRGASWELLEVPFGSPVLALAAPSDSDDATLVATTHFGAFFSCDDGTSWHLLDRLMRLEDDACDLDYAGDGWEGVDGTGSGNHVTRSATVGDTASVGFAGSGVRWHAARGPDGGTATAFVDGAEIATVDLYAAQDGAPEVVFTHDLEAHGWHELTVEVAGGGVVEIDAVDVIRHRVDNGPGEAYEVADWCIDLETPTHEPPPPEGDGCCATSCDHDRSPASAAVAAVLLGLLVVLRWRR